MKAENMEVVVAKYRQLVDKCVGARTKRLDHEAGRQVLNLVDYLEKKTAWLTAPASSKYHRSHENGLLAHSVDVAVVASQLAEVLSPSPYYDSVLLCGLFHDVGKLWSSTADQGLLHSRYTPNILKSGKQSEAAPYEYVKGGHGISGTIANALLVQKFVDVSDAELQALMGSDGQYVEVNKSLAHNEHPLTLIIHYADYWVCHVMESGLSADWLREGLKRS